MRLVPFVIATRLARHPFHGRDRLQTGAQSRAARAGLLSSARIAVTTASLAIAANNQSARLAALDHVPRGARLVHFVARGLREALGRCRATPILARWRSSAATPFPTINGRSRAPICCRCATPPPAASAPIRRRSYAPLHVPTRDAWPVGTGPLPTFPRDAFDYVWTIDFCPASPRAMSRCGAATIAALYAKAGLAKSARPAKEKP